MSTIITNPSPKIKTRAGTLFFNMFAPPSLHLGLRLTTDSFASRWVFLLSVLIGISFMSLLGEDVIAQQQSTTFTLQESIAFAKENSKSIKMAIENVELAKGKVNEAISAMLPNLSGSGSYTYFLEPPVVLDEKTMADMQKALSSIFPPGMTMPSSTEGGITMPQSTEVAKQGPTSIEADKHNYKASATLQQPLFTWGKLMNNYKQAKLNWQAAEQGLESAKQKLELDVTNAFYGVVLVQEFVKVSEKAVAQVEKHVKTANDLFEAGVATNFDVLRASVQLANVRSQLIKAQNGLRLAKEGFKITLGFSLEAEVDVDGQLEYNQQEVDLEELLKLSKENRPDLKQLELQEKAGEKIVSIAKAGNKPNLIFLSNYDATFSTNYEEEVDRDWKKSWNLTFALNVPIFDGLATRARVKQAKSGLHQIKLGKAQLEDGIQLEVKSAYLALQEAQSLLDTQRETVQQAEESLRIANLQHENGMITSVQLTDAELALTQAQVNRLQALYDYTIAIAKIEKAIGRKL
ncbi:TolC family protein [Candidatus Poribacteria bacterium]|nr:TolC family protein [Candidatus Poribacteria bacterium]